MPDQIPALLYRVAALRTARALPADAGEAGDAEGGEPTGADLEIDAAGRIRVALSSEAPVTRYDWMTGDEFAEVLDHGAIDLSRWEAQGGLPLITDHQAWNSDAQVGVLEDPEVGEDGMLRAWARFSAAPRAQQYRQDVVDGIRRTVSIGYSISDNYTSTQAEGEVMPTRSYTDWSPREGSFAPVPADSAVGFGRSADAERAGTARIPHPAAMRQEFPRMTQVATPSTPPAPAAAVVTVSDGGERTAQVRELAALAKQHQMEQHLPRWIETNVTTTSAAIECASEAQKRNAQVRTDAPLVSMTERERKSYSIARAILHDNPEFTGKIDAGFEREVSDSIRKEAAARGLPVVNRGSLMIASRLTADQHLGRATLSSSTASSGGVFKLTQPGDFIDYLYARIKTIQLGAQMLSGLTGPIQFPSGLVSSTANWMGEAPGSAATEAAATFGSVALAFNTLIATQPLSKQLLFSAASGSYDAEQIIRADIAKQHAVALETAAIVGTGSSQPTGIVSTSGVNAVTMGANGGTITWAKILEFETAISDQNADVDAMAYLSNSKQRGALRNIPVMGNTAGAVPVWTFGNGPEENRVMGYRAAVSNCVPRNLTKGTSTTICSAIIFGDFSSLIYGEWGGFEILSDPYTQANKGNIVLTSFQAASSVVRQPKAFAVMPDAL